MPCGFLQVNLCKKLLFLHQLTHNMTTDCSLNYKFNIWKFQAQSWGEHFVYRNCFWHSEQWSFHVLQKEELLTKIYLYSWTTRKIDENNSTNRAWNGGNVESIQIQFSHRQSQPKTAQATYEKGVSKMYRDRFRGGEYSKGLWYSRGWYYFRSRNPHRICNVHEWITSRKITLGLQVRQLS